MSAPLRLFTIGFTKTSAEHFFDRLCTSGAKKLVDVRLNNVSQLAGFAKRDDLRFFAGKICGLPYQHMPAMAPTQEMLDGYRKSGASWSAYEHQFLQLIAARRIEQLPQHDMDGACLLCSEDRPHKCHRRLVAEYLRSKWGNVEITHL